MIFYGMVVRFKQRPKELYVVKEAKYNGSYLINIILMPFNHSNTSTHISREHPLKTKAYVDELCQMGECDCWSENSGCPKKDIPSPIFNIDEIEYVADCVTDFMKKRFEKLMFE